MTSDQNSPQSFILLIGLASNKPSNNNRMTREEATIQIQEACKTIALQMMKIHPAVPALQDEGTQSDVLKSAHQLTVELETIKKKLIQLQKRDDSAEL